MFLVKQGCPYRPHYYSDNNVLDQDRAEQYKDCVKTATPRQVSYLRNNIKCGRWPMGVLAPGSAHA